MNAFEAIRQSRERGATMVEYAILATLIAVVAAVGVRLIGPPLRDMYASVAPYL